MKRKGPTFKEEDELQTDVRIRGAQENEMAIRCRSRRIVYGDGGDADNLSIGKARYSKHA
ncbi:hypothetical protein KIN20_032714 [Parelaphostrongylus tenuis]|uniref:Uncharacterized protein n=1 Tax=Parelaphostrongylus tenuis TaxID=148309 RepID=A0AAD5R7H2_PARTN|nr:hypothetical protein KIN20_032714 [Parelaphostrongylus tenuis]